MPDPSASSVADRVRQYNRGRIPDLVAYKFRKMKKSPFHFFRGTAHLFWEDWSSIGSALDEAPLVWTCGDLHLENFGAYRGDNALTYFDLNDFDEGALAPTTRDPARLLVSAYLAGESLGLGAALITQLESAFLDAYIFTLGTGKARWVERATARGMVRDLLRGLRSRTRRQLLSERTKTVRGHRRLRMRKGHTVRLDETSARRPKDILDAFAATQLDAEQYRVLDVAARITGIGSLGFERYIALVRGLGGAENRRLIDIKQAHASAMSIHMPRILAARQPTWRDDATRVVDIQRRMQAIPPALLGTVSLGRDQFVVRELQPTDDRLDLETWNGRIGRLERVVATMGQLAASAQLRSASREGAATIDALMAFGRQKSLRRRLVSFARDYAARTKSDWREFKEADPIA